MEKNKDENKDEQTTQTTEIKHRSIDEYLVLLNQETLSEMKPKIETILVKLKIISF
jgi:hypothetical protein